MWWVKWLREVGRLRLGLWVSRHFRDGEDGCSTYRLVGLAPPDQDLKTCGSHEDVPPLQVCREGSNWAADGGTRFDCLSLVKKPKVRHTRKAGPRAPRLGVME